MARKGYQEISVDVPDAWHDRTVLAFAAPPAPTKVSQPSMVITREVAPEGMTLRTFAAKQLAVNARGLPDYELEESGELLVAGQPALEARFTWSADRGAVFQRQIVVWTDQAAFTIMQTCAQSDAADAMPMFDGLLRSVQLGPVARQGVVAPSVPPLAAPLSTVSSPFSVSPPPAVPPSLRNRNSF